MASHGAGGAAGRRRRWGRHPLRPSSGGHVAAAEERHSVGFDVEHDCAAGGARVPLEQPFQAALQIARHVIGPPVRTPDHPGDLGRRHRLVQHQRLQSGGDGLQRPVWTGSPGRAPWQADAGATMNQAGRTDLRHLGGRDPLRNNTRGLHHNRPWYWYDLDAVREPLLRGAVWKRPVLAHRLEHADPGKLDHRPGSLRRSNDLGGILLFLDRWYAKCQHRPTLPLYSSTQPSAAASTLPHSLAHA